MKKHQKRLLIIALILVSSLAVAAVSSLLTTAPMDGITLKNMEVSDFLDIQDFNIQVTGYLAETSEYGSDPETAWGQIGE